MDLKQAEELDGETRLDIKRGMFHILNLRDKSAEFCHQPSAIFEFPHIY